MENEDDFTKSISRQLSFDLIFPHSKIVEIINVSTDKMAEKNFFEGHNSKALIPFQYFDRCGLPPSYLS
jgi:hypothetical protein